jgi:membrane-bound metal-dependent hydrolase YbcI (DUF457 family)
MYAGHFAAGLALKAMEPNTPTWALLLGVGVLDLLFGILLVAGIERATITPGIAPGFSLDFIDWSHSLLMSLAWAALYAAFFVRKRGLAVAAVCGFAVFSHFLLDFLMHPGDLALWPYSNAHIGLGIWRLFPTGWWVFELAFIVLCSAYYLARAKTLKTFGGRGFLAVGVVVLLHVTNSPWLSPAH